MFTDEKAGPKPWQGLFDRLLSSWDVPRGANGEGVESRLASSVYTCPRQYQGEVSRLFRGLPICLGHVDQLPVGSVAAREVVGLPLLLTRDAEGGVRVLLNACRHRGAKLVTDDQPDCGQTSISCRYHGWTYGLDGQLLSVPRREAFPTLDPMMHGLRQLPSTVRHGLVWVVLNPDGGHPLDMTAWLGELDRDLLELGIGGHHCFRRNAVTRQANWKLIIDAFIEFYHIKRLHATTIGQYFADTKAACENVGPHVRMLVGRDGFEAIRQLPRGQWSPRHHATLVHFVFPNSLLVYHPDYTSHIGVYPVAIDRSLFVHTVLTPEVPSDEKARSHWERSFDLIDTQVFDQEDLFICEQIQLGLPAMKDSEFVLGGYEANVRQFHATIAAELAR
jgi:phenylpropionate dioxygenase-like ring-hydroxylating dioxygenase large terminal subunit